MNTIVLVNFAVHSLLLCLPGWILVRWVLRDARQRSWAAVITLGASSLAPLLLSLVPPQPQEPLPPPPGALQAYGGEGGAVRSLPGAFLPKEPGAAEPAGTWDWNELMPGLLRAWLTGAGLLGLLHLGNTVRAYLWHRRLRPGCRPEVWTFKGQGSPCVTGIVRPVVAVPESANTGWTEDQWRWLLAHEREHLRGRDPAIAWLLGWVRACLWWNPLVHDLSGQWAQAREEVCDAVASAPAREEERYAEFLLEVAAGKPVCGALSMAASLPARRLKARLLALMNRQQVCNRVGWQFSLGTGIVLIASMFVANGAGFPVNAAPPAAAKSKEAPLSAQQPGTPSGIAAIVNQKVITNAELTEAANAERGKIRLRSQKNPDQMETELAQADSTALDALIERELVLEEFKKMGGTIKAQYVDEDINAIINEQFKGDRDAFVSQLAKNGKTLEQFRELREKMMIVAVMRAKFGKTPAPTAQEIEEYYKAHPQKWRDNDMLLISTITIPKSSREPGVSEEQQKQLAQEVRTKLEEGADFAELARKYSQDSQASSSGKWGWMSRSKMNPPIARAVATLDEGKTSAVIGDKAAYLIVRLDARRSGPDASLEEARAEIERSISAERSQIKVKQWLDGLRTKADIRKGQQR